MNWALVTDVDLETANVALPELEAAGLLGMVEQDGRVTAYFPERVEGLPVDGHWERVPEHDWNERWKAGIEPVTVASITITPPWIDVPGALVIEPARAFGTGHHETTVGCLRALQGVEVTGSRVLDVGTGTGILALAAKRLGAAEVVAVDVDDVAVATARGNAECNALDLDVRPGSVEAAAGPFDIVLANLDTPTLRTLATALAATLGPAGVLIASGVSRERAGEARAALEAAGLEVAAVDGIEWTVLEARRRSGP